MLLRMPADTPDVCQRFGTKLRNQRTRRNWSQDDLAERSGIGRQHISDLENGKREPCLRSLESLAGSFGISIARLISGL